MENTAYEPITNSAEMFSSRPLFGVTTRREKIINWTIAIITGLFLLVTFICSCAAPSEGVKGSNVFLSICLTILGSSHLLLIRWYRQGDLDPKFLRLIYFNALILNQLCLCGMLFIFRV